MYSLTLSEINEFTALSEFDEVLDTHFKCGFKRPYEKLACTHYWNINNASERKSSSCLTLFSPINTISTTLPNPQPQSQFIILSTIHFKN